MISLFSLSGIIIFISSILTGFFVYFKKPRSKLSQIWLLYTLSVAWWGYGTFLIGNVYDYDEALFYWRLAHIGVIFIPSLLLHFVYLFLKLRSYIFVIINYIVSCIFLILNVSGLLINKVTLLFGNLYYDTPPTVYYIFFTLWWIYLVVHIYLKLIFSLKHKRGIERSRIKYFIFTVIGFIGGGTCFLPVFGIPIYPYGNFVVPFYTLIIAYAILKYHLMDIRVFFSRTVAFFLSYPFFLSIPFIFAYKTKHVFKPSLGDNWWLPSSVMLVFFSTIAPIIFIKLNRKMENRLLADQFRYQRLLKQSAEGMVRQHDLQKLVRFIVRTVKNAIQIKFVCLFIEEKKKNRYRLAAYRGDVFQKKDINFPLSHALISYLRGKKHPLLYEELPAYIRVNIDFPEQIDLIIPMVVDSRLVGFAFLGEKLNKDTYSPYDMDTFKILSSQAALVINHCLFLEEFKATQQKLAEAEKLAAVGGMADGMSHQMRNRLNQFSVVAGVIQYKTEKFMSENKELVSANEKLKDLLEYFKKASQNMIDNVLRTEGIIRGILDYARIQEKKNEFARFKIKNVVEQAINLVKVKHQLSELNIIVNIEEDQEIYGMESQISEIIYNIIDNSYEAIEEKRCNLENEERILFKEKIEIDVKNDDDSVLITIKDNGIGIKKENEQKIFAPFFTTKASSVSGTGIGMYVVKRMVEETHKGKIWFESKYMEGTTFYILFPQGER